MKKEAYNIYDYFEDLKAMQWSKQIPDEAELKYWCDYFIGDGWYDIINQKIMNIYKSLLKVDMDYVNDRLLEIWDDIPESIDRYVYSAVAYGDYKRHDLDDEQKYNGMIFVKNINDRKIDIIVHMIKEIIYPTMFIGYPSTDIRTTDEQIFAWGNWKCDKFDFKNIEIPTTKYYISKSDKKEKYDYSVEKVISMYQPTIVIDIGRNINNYRNKIDINFLESRFDKVLPSILNTLEYKSVIWDKSRFKRRFVETEFCDYTLKILLK